MVQPLALSMAESPEESKSAAAFLDLEYDNRKKLILKYSGIYASTTLKSAKKFWFCKWIIFSDHLSSYIPSLCSRILATHGNIFQRHVHRATEKPPF